MDVIEYLGSNNRRKGAAPFAKTSSICAVHTRLQSSLRKNATLSNTPFIYEFTYCVKSSPTPRNVANNAAVAVNFTVLCPPISSQTRLRFAASNWPSSSLPESRIESYNQNLSMFALYQKAIMNNIPQFPLSFHMSSPIVNIYIGSE
jgi:hypothetical protein